MVYMKTFPYPLSVAMLRSCQPAFIVTQVGGDVSDVLLPLGMSGSVVLIELTTLFARLR